MLSKEEVEKLAFLAKVKLDPEEKVNAPKELEAILKYIQKLNTANTEGIEPLFHFPELKNVVREDVAYTTNRDTQKKMMAMGKDKDDYLKVESIL